jgi:hypothetical protein
MFPALISQTLVPVFQKNKRNRQVMFFYKPIFKVNEGTTL